MGKLVSVQVGEPQELPAKRSSLLGQQPWSTGIFKSVVEGEVVVGEIGLEGDGQADLINHGGIDKAICVYSVDHYSYWQSELGLPEFGNGSFGENFSVTGFDESSVCIGDHWQVGNSVFEVSQPRQPCWKLARRWNLKTLALLVQASGRTGWYLRVVGTGTVCAGQGITLLDRPYPQWSVLRADDIKFKRGSTGPEELAELLRLEPLSAAWKSDLRD